MFYKEETKIDVSFNTFDIGVLSAMTDTLGRGKAVGTTDKLTVWSEKGDRWLALI